MFQPAIPVFGMVLPPLIWQRDFFPLNFRSATGSLQDLEQCPAPQVRRSGWAMHTRSWLECKRQSLCIHGCLDLFVDRFESGSNCSNRDSSFDTDHTTLIYQPSLFGETCLSMQMTSRLSSLISAITSKHGQVSSYICVASITLIISTIANSNEFFLHTCAKSPCARNPLRRSCLGSFFRWQRHDTPAWSCSTCLWNIIGQDWLLWSGAFISRYLNIVIRRSAYSIAVVRLFKPWRLIMNR